MSPVSPEPRPLLRRADQLTVAVLTAAGGVALLCYLGYAQWRQGGLIEIDRAGPLEARFTVDVNTAGWAELAQLPQIGEVLARRIVELREAEGGYRAPQDLLRVRGIGPRTLEQLRPYLRPLPDEETIVNSPATMADDVGS